MSQVEETPSILTSFLKNCFAGSLGGVAQVFSGQPFDIVKVRMQSQSSLNPIYSGPLDWSKKIYKTEGALAFYKGTLAPLSGVAVWTSVQFGLNELFKKMCMLRNKSKTLGTDKLTTAQYTLWGGFVGIGNAFISTPVEHIRIGMQQQTSNKGYSGSLDAFKGILRKYGTTGVYRGYMVTTVRDIVSFAIFFGVYEPLKQRYNKPEKPKNLPLLMAFGGLASILLWIGIYPIDVAKTVFQSDNLAKPAYSSSIQVAKEIYRTEGLRGFGKGFVPCMIRAPIIYAATVLAYETSLSMLGD